MNQPSVEPPNAGRAALWRILERLSTVAVLVTAVVAVTVMTRRPARPVPFELPGELVSLAGAPTLGSANASTGIVVYSDFECPFCARFAKDTWPTLKERFIDSGRVLVAFRHLPLPSHANAKRAAAIAECAARQGKFWRMHDMLFGNQASLSEQTFAQLAVEAQLDAEEWSRCSAPTGGAMTRVEDDLKSATDLGIRSTPFFLVGTLSSGGLAVHSYVNGARPLEAFEAAIEKAQPPATR